jgi:hypothetical protein
MYSPMDFTGSEENDDISLKKPFVYFEGRVDKLDSDRIFALPVDGPGGSVPTRSSSSLPTRRAPGGPTRCPARRWPPQAPSG